MAEETKQPNERIAVVETEIRGIKEQLRDMNQNINHSIKELKQDLTEQINQVGQKIVTQTEFTALRDQVVKQSEEIDLLKGRPTKTFDRIISALISSGIGGFVVLILSRIAG